MSNKHLVPGLIGPDIYRILVAYYGELHKIIAINLPKASPVFAVRRTVTSAPSLNDALSILCGLSSAAQYTYPRLHVYRSEIQRMRSASCHAIPTL